VTHTVLYCDNQDVALLFGFQVFQEVNGAGMLTQFAWYDFTVAVV
jgi:hypothetical protein